MNAQPTRLRKLDYVQHMLDAIRLVQSYVEGMTREAFLADKKTQQAVVLNILIIGEAAAQVGNEYPPGWADQQSQIPWRSMRGMPNRLAHGYFEINLELVWDTVQLSLVELEVELVKILEERSPGRQ